MSPVRLSEIVISNFYYCAPQNIFYIDYIRQREIANNHPCRSHPDVQKFKPTALRMAKAYVQISSRVRFLLGIELICSSCACSIRHRGPDWSESCRIEEEAFAAGAKKDYADFEIIMKTGTSLRTRPVSFYKGRQSMTISMALISCFSCVLVLVHERLSIVGVGTDNFPYPCMRLLHRNQITYLLLIDTGSQPLVNDDASIALAVNGEIYNHRILRKSLDSKYNYKTHSDCEVIIPLVRVPCL